MKVILLCDIAGRGYKGDVLDVSDGYARNFLFPQACAVPATPEALQKRKAEDDKRTREAKEQNKAARKTAESLDGKEILMCAKANEDGTLYAAVREKDIAAALKKHGFSVPENAIILPGHIKDAGDYKITAEFSGGFEAEFKLTVEGVVDKKKKREEDA